MEYSSKLACLLALALAMAAGIARPCVAQNSPQDYVDQHNAARANVGVGPVSWDDTVAAYAQGYAYQLRGDCKLVPSGGPYGENGAWGFAGDDWTAAGAVTTWVSEKQYYDHGSNSCSAPEACLYYTQVVWRNSRSGETERNAIYAPTAADNYLVDAMFNLNYIEKGNIDNKA